MYYYEPKFCPFTKPQCDFKATEFKFKIQIQSNTNSNSLYSVDYNGYSIYIYRIYILG